MKKLLFILSFLLCFITAFSQLPTVVEVGQDSFRIKRGEFVLRNSTKDVLGVLVNTGGGVTRFKEFRVANDSTLIFDGDTLIFNNASVTGSSNDTVVNVGLGAAIYKGKDGREFQMKTLVSDSSIVFTSFDDSLRLQVDPGVFSTVTRLLDSIAAVRADQVSTWQNTLDVPTGSILTRTNKITPTDPNFDFSMWGGFTYEFLAGDTTFATPGGRMTISPGEVNAYGSDNPNIWAQYRVGGGVPGALDLTATSNVSATDDMQRVMSVRRQTTAGTVQNGFGGFIGLDAQVNDNGSTDDAVRLGWKWLDATEATRTSQFEIHVVDNAVIARALAITGNKQLILDGYGSGTFTGIVSKWLGVTADGHVIEIDTLTSVGGEANIYANNGVSRVVDTVQLGATNNTGSPLLHNTWINTDPYTLTIRGSSANWPLQVENTSTGYAARLFATAKPAIQAVVNPASTSTIAPALEMLRTSSGSIANGIGVGTDYYIQTTIGGTTYAGTTGFAWSDITHASRTSRFDVSTVSAGAAARKLSVAGNGKLTLDRYGVGSFPGTPVWSLGVLANGDVVEYTPSTGGSGISAVTGSNGAIATTPSNIEFGTNPLLHNTTVPTGAFSMTWTGAFSGNLFNVTNTNTTGAAINAVGGTAGAGVLGTGGQYGVFGQTTGGTAVRGVSSTGLAGDFNGSALAVRVTSNPISTNTVQDVMQLIRTSTGTAANGIGGALTFLVKDAGGLFQTSHQLVSKWTDVTNISRTSQFELYNTNNATFSRAMAITGPGQMILDKYGSGAFTGTATKLLATTSTGNVIEVDPGDVGGVGGTVTADRGLHISGSSNVRWGGSSLDSAVDIDQASNGITFHDGLFMHGTGDYLGFTGAYTLFQTGDSYLLSDHNDGAGTETIIQSTLSSGGQVNLQAFSPSGASTVLVSGVDGININAVNGQLFFPNLIDSAQDYFVHGNLINGKITLSAGLPSGAVTNFGGAHEIGVVSGGTVQLKTLVAGGGVTITETDSTITVSAAGAGSEVNTLAFTLTTTGNRTIAADNIVQYVLVKPASTLAGLKIGTASDDDFYLTATPVTGGAWATFNLGEYLATGTTFYFSGITSSTDIKIVYKPLHE